MCFSSPKIPKPRALPVAPQPDSDATRQREQQEASILAAQAGTAATIKTDLSPSSITGQKRVLLGV